MKQEKIFKDLKQEQTLEMMKNLVYIVRKHIPYLERAERKSY